MSLLTNRIRLPWLAVVAVVGMLSSASYASASTASSAARNGTRACCAQRVCTCCAKPGSAASLSESRWHPVARSTWNRALLTPSGCCECRPGVPATPISGRETRVSESRAGQAQGDWASLTCHATTHVQLDLQGICTSNPSPSPLYLSTARLRF
jgi:hypothetical protein